MSKAKILLRLMEYAKKYKGGIFILICLGFVSVAFGVLSPLPIKYIIDTLFVTEQKYVENGLLNGVENVTNTQTYLNTHISDDILLGKGNGTIETMDGQNITWISSDIGRQIDDKWVFNGITLFNNTQGDSLSILNNSIALTKSQSGPILADYMWLLE